MSSLIPVCYHEPEYIVIVNIKIYKSYKKALTFK